MDSHITTSAEYRRDPRTMPIAYWEETLDGFKQTGPGQWSANCPAHDDTGQHLSITEKDGKRQFNCYKCDPKDLWATLLELINDDGHESTSRETKENTPLSIIRVKADAPSPALQWYADYCYTTVDKLSELGIIEGAHENEPHVCFTWPGDLTSRMRCRRVNSKEFRWSNGPGPSPDFWPALSDTVPETIYVVEGESDCIMLRTGGMDNAYAATKGATGVPDPGLLTALKQRGTKKAVVLFDCDKTGRDGVKKLQVAFEAAGINAILVDITPLVNVLNYEKDIRDARKHVDSNEELVEKVRALASRTATESALRGLTFDEMAALCPNGVTWRLYPFIPDVGTVMLSGDPDAGKSRLFMELFACADKGTPFLDYPCTPFRILYMSEDSMPMLVDRSRAYGFPKNVYTVTYDAVVGQGKDWSEIVRETLKLARQRGVQLVVFDTTLRWAQIEDTNSAAAVTAALNECYRFKQAGMCVMLVMHDRKAGGTGTERIAGSQAFGGAADVHLSITQEGTGDDRGATRRVKVERNKLTLDEKPSFSTKIDNGRLVRTDSPKIAQIKQSTDDILTLLGDHPNGLTVAEIVEQSKSRGTPLELHTTRRRLKVLEEKQKVCGGPSKGGKRYKLYGTPRITYTTDSNDTASDK